MSENTPHLCNFPFYFKNCTKYCLFSGREGFDEIPGKLLKDLGFIAHQPLTWLFNTIVLIGRIQKARKVSLIVQLFKKGEKVTKTY